MIETTTGTKKSLSIVIKMLGMAHPAFGATKTQAAHIEPSTGVFLLALATPFAAIIALPLLKDYLGDDIAFIGAGASLVSFIGLISQKDAQGALSFDWIESMGISATFYIDGLSVLLGLLASGIGILVFIYSREYMKGEEGLVRFYALLMAFLGSMLGLVFSGDLIMLFVFWEMTSVSSFLLIGYHRDSDSSQYAARKSMLITVGGGLFLLIAFILLDSVTGSFNLAGMLSHPAEVQRSLRSAELYLPVIGFLTVGAAAKSAQVPLHIWLPDAMEAPTPVSAFLHSATMVKAGVFLLGRFKPILAGEAWTAVLVPLGLMTMTLAGYLAVISTDIKELLAYSTASHLGLIVAGFGFSSGLGSATGSFHIFNHALFKASLFMVAGIVAHEAGTRKIGELSGLRQHMPFTALIATVAGLSMAGIPPLGGFQSKEILFKSAFHMAETSGGLTWLYPLIAVGGSVFTFIYSFRFISMFYGAERRPAHSPSRLFLLPPGLLLGGIVTSSLLPQGSVNFVVQSAISSTGSGYALHPHLIPKLSVPLAMSAVTMMLGVGAYRGREQIMGAGRGIFERHPYLSADRWYDTLVTETPRVSAEIVEKVQSGRIRDYVTVVAAGTSLAGLTATLMVTNSLRQINLVPNTVFAIVLGIAGLSAFKMTRTRSDFTGVMMLSIIGSMVAIFYVVADAPDLALTQVSVETLSLMIFLLVLDRLPSYYGEIGLGRKVKDSLISVFVGVSAFWSVMLATSARPDKIAGFFKANSVPEGGGGNIVNVILVDFRGIDTMGEISVIAMAGIAIIVLLSARNRNMKGEIE